MENKGELSANAAGDMTVRVQGTLKTALILKLRGFMQAYEQEPENVKAELADITEYLDRHLIEIKSIKPKKAGKKQEPLYTYTYSARAYEGQTLEQVKQEINRRLSSEVVTYAVSDMTGRVALLIAYLRDVEKLKEKQRQRTRIKTAPQINENILRAPAVQQPDLFSSLEREDQAKVVRQTGDIQTAITFINRKGQGINLSEDEEKMIQVIQELLHEKSQNTNEKSADYFIGNPAQESGGGAVTRGDENKTQTYPKLLISVTEAARKFSGQDRPGGREQATARRIITEMATNPDKHCLMQIRIAGDALPQQNRRRRKKVLETTVSEYAPLWTILQVDRKMEDGQEDRELYLKLHHIFRTGIEERAIRMPALEAIGAAYGNRKLPKAVQRFIRLLSEAHTHIKTKTKIGEGRRSHEIGQIKLFQQIAPDYNRPGKMKRIALTEALLTKGIEAAKKLGMIAGASTRKNPDGEVIYIFELVEGWRTGGDPGADM